MVVQQALDLPRIVIIHIPIAMQENKKSAKHIYVPASKTCRNKVPAWKAVSMIFPLDVATLASPPSNQLLGAIYK